MCVVVQAATLPVRLGLLDSIICLRRWLCTLVREISIKMMCGAGRHQNKREVNKKKHQKTGGMGFVAHFPTSHDRRAKVDDAARFEDGQTEATLALKPSRLFGASDSGAGIGGFRNS